MKPVKNTVRISCAVALVTAAAIACSQEPSPPAANVATNVATNATTSTATPGAFTPLVSIKELMEKTITPATNTIWSFYQAPSSISEWEDLEEAAVTMVAASSLNAVAGTGPSDADWVQQPTWIAFNTVMTQAAQDALTAIRARDHDALLVAADIMYPPCEGCHLQFNPGVVNAE